MEHQETVEDCNVEVKSEVKQVGNDDLEHNVLDEITPPAQVILGIKNEEPSDEEELEQPSQVTVEAFKEEVLAGCCAKNLPVPKETPVSLSRSQTSFQWKEQGLLSRQISCNKHLVQSEDKGVLPNSPPCVGCQWMAADVPNSVGAPVKDVQYVWVKSVKSGNNNASGGRSGKNIVKDKSIKMTAAVVNQNIINSNGAVGNNSAELEVVEISAKQGKIVVIPTGSSIKRSSDLDTALGYFGLKQTEILRKKKKTENQNISSSEPACVKIACDVNSCPLKCTTVFNKDERSQLYRAFQSLSAEDQKKFIMQCCCRKICLRSVKESKNSTSDMTFEEYIKYDFMMRSIKGVPVQVCKLFFASILGFTDNYFNSYLSDMYENANIS